MCVPPSTEDVMGGSVLCPQRPSLARVVEWIDFETLALLFGMVITGPGGRGSRVTRALAFRCHCCSSFTMPAVPSRPAGCDWSA